MAQKDSIPSNDTGLRVAEETSIGVLPGTPTWVPLEPNSYPNFGPSVSNVARSPINPDRMDGESVLVDADAGGGFNSDVTQKNFQSLLQGLFFSTLENKTEFGGAGEITNVDGTAEEYDAASGLDAFAAGQLVFASGFTNSANNGLKRVTAAAATALTVAEDLVDEAAPPSAAKLVEVGVQGAAGDIDVDASGTLPAITSTTLDFTTLGLVVGEYLFIGGDAAGLRFTNSANNGFKRIRSIAANRIEFDKSASAMATEASVAETVQLFYGRVLRNRTGTDIIRRTYQFERTLGAPDDAAPADIQAEYHPGSVLNEFTWNSPLTDKVTADLTFLSQLPTYTDGPTALKTGNRPSVEKGAAFNTTSDLSRINMHVVTPGNESPTPVFTFIQEWNFLINNGFDANKAQGRLGAFDFSNGNFVVSGNVNSYFGNVSALQSVLASDRVTLEAHYVKTNAGVSIDFPLVKLATEGVNIEKDASALLPLDFEASTGCPIDDNLNHVALMVFWDYLPTAADS